MGGYNPTQCLKEACPNWKGQDCEEALEILSTLNIETGSTRQRIVCGKKLVDLSTELSDIQVINRALDGHIPLVVDRVIEPGDSSG